MCSSDLDIGLVIDRDFRSIYEGRTEHPLEEGEVSDLMPDGSVARVGKKALPAADAVGEYIGLARLGERGARTVANTLDQLANSHIPWRCSPASSRAPARASTTGVNPTTDG